MKRPITTSVFFSGDVVVIQWHERLYLGYSLTLTLRNRVKRDVDPLPASVPDRPSATLCVYCKCFTYCLAADRPINHERCPVFPDPISVTDHPQLLDFRLLPQAAGCPRERARSPVRSPTTVHTSRFYLQHFPTGFCLMSTAPRCRRSVGHPLEYFWRSKLNREVFQVYIPGIVNQPNLI